MALCNRNERGLAKVYAVVVERELHCAVEALGEAGLVSELLGHAVILSFVGSEAGGERGAGADQPRQAPSEGRGVLLIRPRPRSPAREQDEIVAVGDGGCVVAADPVCQVRTMSSDSSFMRRLHGFRPNRGNDGPASGRTLPVR